MQDFSVLTQSRDKSRESCKYWINYNWAKPQKSLVKEKDNFFFFCCCCYMHLEEKNTFPDKKKPHFYKDIYAFTLQLGWDFLEVSNGEMRSTFFLATGLISSFAFIVQSLNFGLMERFVVCYIFLLWGSNQMHFPAPLICYFWTQSFYFCAARKWVNAVRAFSLYFMG